MFLRRLVNPPFITTDSSGKKEHIYLPANYRGAIVCFAAFGVNFKFWDSVSKVELSSYFHAHVKMAKSEIKNI